MATLIMILSKLTASKTNESMKMGLILPGTISLLAFSIQTGYLPASSSSVSLMNYDIFWARSTEPCSMYRIATGLVLSKMSI
jgi:hypothetical protein